MKLRLSSYILTFTPIVMSAVAVLVWCGCGDDGKNISYMEFTDVRDSKTYKALKMPDGKIWMAENLNFTTDSSWCYDDEDSNCVKYGRLYNWEAAMSACPAGWRLSDKQDWDKLIKTTGRGSAGKNLKSKPPIWDGRDKFGFAASPGGLRYWHGEFYRGAGYGGSWWLATKRSTTIYGDYFCRYMYVGMNNVDKVDDENTLGETPSYGYSVRCLRDVR